MFGMDNGAGIKTGNTRRDGNIHRDWLARVGLDVEFLIHFDDLPLVGFSIILVEGILPVEGAMPTGRLGSVAVSYVVGDFDQRDFHWDYLATALVVYVYVDVEQLAGDEAGLGQAALKLGGSGFRFWVRSLTLFDLDQF